MLKVWVIWITESGKSLHALLLHNAIVIYMESKLILSNGKPGKVQITYLVGFWILSIMDFT